MKITRFLCGILLGASLVQAQTGSSANYTTTTTVLDSGGQKTSSANYTNDGSIGAVGRFTAFGAYNSRGGFPGQLFELTNVLAVNLAPPTIGETLSRQLAVQAVANDTTRVDLAPASVTWSSAGPVSINASGSATGSAVYQDTAATATATQGGATGQLALTILETLPDNFGLYGGDGIDDSWQIGFFGVDQAAGLATADPDGDGQNNHLEFLAETTPVDPLSQLRLRIENVPDKPGWKSLIFSPYSKKRSYEVKWSENFDKWFRLDFFNEGDLGDEHYITDEDAQGPQRFYRLEISR